MVYDVALQHTRRRAKSAIVSGGKTAISTVYPSRFNNERRAKSSRIKSAIMAYPWRVARPAEISYAEIRHASRAPGEVVKVDERKERKKRRGSSRWSVQGERSRQPGPFEVDRFQYGTRPYLMTRKLVRPTANGDTLAGARHHSIFRNTSGQGLLYLFSPWWTPTTRRLLKNNPRSRSRSNGRAAI